MVQLFVNIDVDDLEKAIEFYRSAFGLTLKRRLFNDAVAEMAGASSPIYLLKKRAGSAPSATVPTLRDYRRHWTPVHFDLVVDDLGPAVQRAQAAGAIVESDPQTYEWGRIAFMADPFGHGFCLLEFRNGDYESG
jgi:predicted enzyme related to lactoylglutathione lyase